MIATDKYLAVTKDLVIDLYDFSNSDHKLVVLPKSTKVTEKDYISDSAISRDNAYLAVVTAISKQLIVFSLPQLEELITFVIPRSASRIRFAVDNSQILVADKSGDVLLYNVSNKDSGSKLLGHLSLLLDVLQTNNSKYIISCDRDEKIKVSCYPNTYNIQTFCLGHKEFVNHMTLLPHDDKYLTTSSGDGTVKIWDYNNGKLCYTVDTSQDLTDQQIKQNFINLMDEGGIEVHSLPIVHFTASKLNSDTSILAVMVHSNNEVFIYTVRNTSGTFTHKLEDKLSRSSFPKSIQLQKDSIFIYDETESAVNKYKLEDHGNCFKVKFDIKIEIFKDVMSEAESNADQLEAIKVLYKRKFDNVQEYQERKKQRLVKQGK